MTDTGACNTLSAIYWCMFQANTSLHHREWALKLQRCWGNSHGARSWLSRGLPVQLNTCKWWRTALFLPQGCTARQAESLCGKVMFGLWTFTSLERRFLSSGSSASEVQGTEKRELWYKHCCCCWILPQHAPFLFAGSHFLATLLSSNCCLRVSLLGVIMLLVSDRSCENTQAGFCKTYIGETKRTLKAILSDHKQAVKRDDLKNAISVHAQ